MDLRKFLYWSTVKEMPYLFLVSISLIFYSFFFPSKNCTRVGFASMVSVELRRANAGEGEEAIKQTFFPGNTFPSFS